MELHARPFARTHPHLLRWEHLVRADDRDRQDGDARLQRQHEPACLEGQQAAVLGARALGGDPHVDPRLDVLARGVQRLPRALVITAVDVHELGGRHGRPQDRDAEHLLLRDHAKGAGKEVHQQEDVVGALVIGDDPVRARRVHVLEALHERLDVRVLHGRCGPLREAGVAALAWNRPKGRLEDGGRADAEGLPHRQEGDAELRLFHARAGWSRALHGASGRGSRNLVDSQGPSEPRFLSWNAPRRQLR